MGIINRFDYFFVKEFDFIFGVVGEEFGFVGCIIIIIVYVLFILNFIRIVFICKEKFVFYIVVGVVGMFSF